MVLQCGPGAVRGCSRVPIHEVHILLHLPWRASEGSVGLHGPGSGLVLTFSHVSFYGLHSAVHVKSDFNMIQAFCLKCSSSWEASADLVIVLLVFLFLLIRDV